MAIDAIQNNNVISQIKQVEKSAPAERTEPALTEAVATETAEKTFRPVVEIHGSDSRNLEKRDDKDKKDGRKNIQDVSPEKVKSALDDINKKIRPTHTQCEFSYHEKTNRITITVKDSETNEVIKEIPPEKTLDMIAKTLELAGLLVDEKR